MLLLPIACRRPPLANSESGSGRSFYVFWVLCYVVSIKAVCVLVDVDLQSLFSWDGFLQTLSSFSREALRPRPKTKKVTVIVL